MDDLTVIKGIGPAAAKRLPEQAEGLARTLCIFIQGGNLVARIQQSVSVPPGDRPSLDRGGLPRVRE